MWEELNERRDLGRGDGWMDGWRLHEDDEEQENARISDIREAG